METHHSIARSAARLLSGYLCGTRSGLHVLGRPRTVNPAHAAQVHRQAISDNRRLDAAESRLGKRPWEPTGDVVQLRDALGETLSGSGGELVVFGSQARSSTTGFSDLDAILVIPDDVADSADSLRTLRPRVLAAQRAVVAHQPMQHHGFEIVTPRLLADAATALALPVEAVAETRSLFGRSVQARFASREGASIDAFRALTTQLLGVRTWPNHPWETHRLVAMFELVPTLYLQSTGRPISKWLSYSHAGEEFPLLWRPYDVLEQLRQQWPRTRRPALELAMRVVRNPWDAVAAWRRVPSSPPAAAKALLDARCLNELQVLLSKMVDRVA